MKFLQHSMVQTCIVFILLGLGFTFLSIYLTSAAEAEPLSDRRVAYQIDVQLDPSNMKLVGKEKLTWTNPGKKPVSEMFFHLYPNAFSRGSTFVKESGGKLREDRIDFKHPGKMTITSLTFADGSNGLSSLTFVQPDDGNKKDQTLVRLALPWPVYPGEQISIDISFTVQLPKVFARMGYYEDFVMAGQWFPKLAVYEVTGQRNRKQEGWNAHQYHAHSEFYADFGTYEVSITLPSSYRVAATGRMTKDLAVNRDWHNLTFLAEDVHDFAWAASPDFIVKNRDYRKLGEKGITVNLYLDPNHAGEIDRYFQITEQTMRHYEEWFGPYPYDTLTIVVPPPGASGAAGMEYPTLITAWDGGMPTTGLAIEQVVVHELAHQYWYGLVATNEFEEPWLDEGFATYTEQKMMQTIVPDYHRLTLLQPVLHPMPLSLPAWSYNETTYASNVYSRGSKVLQGIEEAVGERTMARILRTYFETYRFDHPSTEDLLRVVNEVSGINFTDYFNRFVYHAQMVDYRVADIQSESLTEGQLQHHIRVEVANGIGQKVPVRILFKDGRTEEINWDTNENPYTIQTTGAPVESVWIDPGFTNPMEINHINNHRRFISTEQIKTWTITVSFWVEQILRWMMW